jgi:hypothetical protein
VLHRLASCCCALELLARRRADLGLCAAAQCIDVAQAVACVLCRCMSAVHAPGDRCIGQTLCSRYVLEDTAASVSNLRIIAFSRPYLLHLGSLGNMALRCMAVTSLVRCGVHHPQ